MVAKVSGGFAGGTQDCDLQEYECGAEHQCRDVRGSAARMHERLHVLRERRPKCHHVPVWNHRGDGGRVSCGDGRLHPEMLGRRSRDHGRPSFRGRWRCGGADWRRHQQHGPYGRGGNVEVRGGKASSVTEIRDHVERGAAGAIKRRRGGADHEQRRRWRERRGGPRKRARHARATAAPSPWRRARRRLEAVAA